MFLFIIIGYYSLSVIEQFIGMSCMAWSSLCSLPRNIYNPKETDGGFFVRLVHFEEMDETRRYFPV